MLCSKVWLAGCVTMFMAVQAWGAVIVVPDDESTIPDAILAASNGDTIEIKKGTYVVHNVSVNKDLTFIGEKRDKTILDNEGQSSSSIFNIIGERTLLFKSLTLKRGEAFQGGAFGSINGTNDGTLTIDNCRLSDNHASQAGGGVIYIDYTNGTVIIKNCLIHGNVAPGGGAIRIDDIGDDGSVAIRSNIFYQNVADRVGGASIHSQAITDAPGTGEGSLIIKRNTFDRDKGRGTAQQQLTTSSVRITSYNAFTKNIISYAESTYAIDVTYADSASQSCNGFWEVDADSLGGLGVSPDTTFDPDSTWNVYADPGYQCWRQHIYAVHRFSQLNEPACVDPLVIPLGGAGTWNAGGLPCCDSEQCAYEPFTSGILQSSATSKNDRLRPGSSSSGLISAEPTPFNPTTLIRFTVPGRPGESNDVLLTIHSPGGRRVIELVKGPLGSGDHSAVWDGTDASGESAPSGVYFARLVTDSNTHTIRVVLIR